MGGLDLRAWWREGICHTLRRESGCRAAFWSAFREGIGLAKVL